MKMDGVERRAEEKGTGKKKGGGKETERLKGERGKAEN